MDINGKTSKELFKTAYNMHAQGQVSGAYQLYRQLLECEDINKVDLYYMYSIALYQLGYFDESLEYLEKVLQIKVDYPPALNQKGVVLQQLQRHDQAQICFGRAIQVQPEYIDAYLNLAKLHMSVSNTEGALKALGNVLKFQPEHFPVLASIAQIYQGKRAHEQAREYYARAIAVEPENVGVLFQQGLVLKALGMYEDAIICLKKALSLQPGEIEIPLQLADVFFKNQQMESAREVLKKLYEMHPHNPRSINAYVAFLIDAKEGFPQAFTILDQLLKNNPRDLNALNMLGLYYMANHEFKKAKEAYEKVLQSDSSQLGTWINLGNLYKREGKLVESEKCYQSALELNPEHPNTQWALSLVLLHLGRYKEGWRYFSARYREGNTHFGHLYRKFDLPFYTGKEDISDKALLLYVEQGYGDAIQFFRFLPLIAKECKCIYFLVHEVLFTLFEENVSSANVIFLNSSVDMDSIEVDYQVPVMDLAKIFDLEMTSVPFAEGYIRKSDHLCEASMKKRIGIVWKSTSISRTSGERSLSLRQFLSLFEDRDDLSIHSFQKELSGEETSLMQQKGIEELGTTFHDFMDTAKAMSCMDLVITVDTAVAHLCAAMGKETWILVATESDWRWGLEGDTTPWYATAKLYRQVKFGQWDSVLERLRKDLEEY